MAPPAKRGPAAQAGTRQIFDGRRSHDRGAGVSSERIAADLAAFRKAGGRIEVLGNTQTLKRIKPDPKSD